MLIDHSREKLLNAIVYFAQNTSLCGKTKLFKLLYTFDFEHYKVTGRSSTGLEYYAWERGPVPVALDDEMDEPKDDFKSHISIVIDRVISYPMSKIVPNQDFDPSHFSKRELQLLSEVANKYKNSTAKDLVDITHVEGSPWDRIYAGGKGYNAHIPYDLALIDNHEQILHLANEHQELIDNYSA